jgi:hypothetical protein
MEDETYHKYIRKSLFMIVSSLSTNEGLKKYYLNSILSSVILEGALEIKIVY